jgi:hypothetical protein
MFDGLLTSTIRYLLLAQVCMTCRISNIDWAAQQKDTHTAEK